MESFVNILLIQAPEVVIQGIAGGAAERPDLHGPELWQVAMHQSWATLVLWAGGAILLEDVVVPSTHFVHSWLYHVTQHLHILPGVDFNPLAKKWGALRPSHC